LFKLLKHVSVECEFNPELDVWLGVDPGRAHPYAIEVCQFTSDDTVQIFDEVYRTGLIDKHAIGLCRQRPWWKNVKGVVMDIAGRQKTVHHERSSAETWEAKTGLPVYTNRVGVEDGISRIDTFLMPDPITERPHLVVNPRCRGLICEMGGGPSPPEVDGVKAWVYPTDDDGNVVRDEPEDRHNDACNALAYLLVHKYGLTKPRKVEATQRRTSAYGSWRLPRHGTTVDRQ
jgi:hypothetical protein